MIIFQLKLKNVILSLVGNKHYTGRKKTLGDRVDV